MRHLPWQHDISDPHATIQHATSPLTMNLKLIVPCAFPLSTASSLQQGCDCSQAGLGISHHWPKPWQRPSGWPGSLHYTTTAAPGHDRPIVRSSKTFHVSGIASHFAACAKVPTAVHEPNVLLLCECWKLTESHAQPVVLSLPQGKPHGLQIGLGKSVQQRHL